MFRSDSLIWFSSLVFYIIGLILFTFVCVVIVSLIPVYLNSNDHGISDNLETTRKALSSLNVTYLLPINSIVRRRRTTVAINPQTAGADLADAVSVPSTTVVVVRITRTTSNGRRRRAAQCDKTTRSGDAVIFGILLKYPSELRCQTLICQIRFFAETNRKFNEVLHVNMTTTDGGTIDLELCRVDSNAGLSNANIDNSDVIIFDNTTATTTTTPTTTAVARATTVAASATTISG